MTTHMAVNLNDEQEHAVRTLLQAADALCSAAIAGQPGLMRIALDYAAACSARRQVLKDTRILSPVQPTRRG